MKPPSWLSCPVPLYSSALEWITYTKVSFKILSWIKYYFTHIELVWYFEILSTRPFLNGFQVYFMNSFPNALEPTVLDLFRTISHECIFLMFATAISPHQ